MSKLFKLKKWLTLEESADYLSKSLSEPVSEADILRFSLDNHLVISINILDNLRAKSFHPIQKENARKVPGIEVKGHPPYEVIIDQYLDEDRYLQPDNIYKTINGVFDLPMIGGERLCCEKYYLKLTNGPEIDAANWESIFVKHPDSEEYFSLQEEFLPERKEGDQRPSWERYDDLVRFPMVDLPSGAIFVVRINSLIDFLSKLNEPEKTEKPLDTRERNTLLTIIAVLCKNLDYDVSKHSKIAGLIASSSDLMGLQLGETTIEGHLKKIPDAVAARSK